MEICGIFNEIYYPFPAIAFKSVLFSYYRGIGYIDWPLKHSEIKKGLVTL